MTVHQAAPGMILAQALPHPKRPGVALLQRGVTLESRVIARLHEFGVRDLWIRFPGMEFMSRHSSPHVQRAQQEVAQRAGELFDEALQGLDPEMDYRGYRDAVESLISKIRSAPSTLVFLDELRATGSSLAASATNVCMLSVLVGIKLDFHLIANRPRIPAARAKDVTNLGIGALLRDVGHMSDPEEQFESSEQEREFHRAHVHRGYDKVRGKTDPAAAAVVLHHHQHYDGTGYPPKPTADAQLESPAADDIHIFARIASAASYFDELRNPTDGGNGLTAVASLHEILRTPKRSWFDPIVLRGLLAVAPPFAPGSLVTLSTGRRAVVTAWDNLDPCKPRVELLPSDKLDPADTTPRETVDLLTQDDVSIIESEGVSVEEHLFHPLVDGEFDLARCTLGNIAEPPRTDPAQETAAPPEGRAA